MSLTTLKTKVEQLIEKAQSSGESEAIDYPEWGFTRPSWWLPRPELTEGDNINECYYLDEVDADVNDYMGVDTSNLEILPNGKKQFWRRHVVTIDMNLTGGTEYLSIPFDKNAIELIINCSAEKVTLPYRFQGDGFLSLQIITGTPLSTGNYLQDGIGSNALKVVDCKIISNNSADSEPAFFRGSSIIKTPQIEWGAGRGASWMFADCLQLREATVERAMQFYGTFSNCKLLESVHLGAECTNLWTSTFSGDTKMKNVTIGKGFSSSLYIHHSTQFTAEVLHAIIENYADMTGQTAPTFQVGATNLKKIDEEHKAMLEAKNINYL